MKLLYYVLCSIISMSILQTSVANRGDPNEGRIELVSSGGNSSQGVLTVYTQGKWNVVCYKDSAGNRVTNNEAAIAACKQLGYNKYYRYSTATILGFKHDNISSTAINGIHCPTVRNPEIKGEVFLMRCDSSYQLINSASCYELVAIMCDVSELKPYSGQVRTYTADSKIPAILQIYFNDQWRPVCGDLSPTVATSACRQMGYTDVSKFVHYPSKKYDGSWQVGHILGSRTSYPCFTDHLESDPEYVNQCSTYSSCCQEVNCNCAQYELICYFNKSNQIIHSSGSQFLCPYPAGAPILTTTVTATCTPSPSHNVEVRFYSFIGALSLETVIVVILVTVVIVLCCKHRRPKNGPPQPNMLVQWWRRNYGAVAQRDD